MGRKIPMWQIAIVMIFTLSALIYSIGFTGYGELHIPLICSAILAAIVAVANGFKWSYLEKGIISSISRSMQAILILIVVGMLIGSWIAGGIVPTMIYYGLMILNPKVFLVASCIICAIVALATGSSWTTAGTIGVAIIGVGMGLGINPAMTAGAIVSGAYFGDKMSPLSDTTNLAPAVAGSNLFDHIKHMVFTVTPSLLIALILYAVLGMSADTSNVDTSIVTLLNDAILSNYYISPVLLVPPVLVIVIVALRIPALPGLIGGTALGVLCCGLFQGIAVGEYFSILHYGWESTTGMAPFVTEVEGAAAMITADIVNDSSISAIDDLLSNGGLDSMLWTVSLIMCAMTFGGIMDASEMLKSLAEALLKIARSTGSLVIVTVFSCIFVNIIASDQYLSIILPGRMYKEAFEDKRLKGKNLSRCLEDSGTITSPLVPWNTCGATMSGFLGVNTVAYLPYAFLNLINPLVSIFYGFTGITMEKMTEEEYQAILKQRALDAKLALGQLD